jgi:hypothetical protein
MHQDQRKKGERQIVVGTGAVALSIVCGIAWPQSVAPDPAQLTAFYANLCVTQSAELPVPYGEADLKGSPNLAPYCQCFGQKFGARALRRLQNPGPAPPAKQSRDEEREMRNGCRQSLGLPLLVFPAKP